MAYFPLFIDLSQRRILVVGAGNVAARKIEKLAPFCSQIEVVADRVNDEVASMAQCFGLQMYTRKFEMSDLQDKDLVIVAVDDLELQKQIFAVCQKNKVPCNSVDSPDYCSFIFPALVQRQDLVIGITTSGRAPGLSRQIRILLDEMFPQQMSELVDILNQFRKEQKKITDSFASRAQVVGEVAQSLLREFLAKTKKD